MSAGAVAGSQDVSWMVAIYGVESGGAPLGCGFVLAEDRVLTCAHVAQRARERAGEVWVAFPGQESRGGRLRVARTVLAAAPGADLVVLYLSGPVPVDVAPAPLRYPASRSLLSRAWWAFGFPGGDQRGNSAGGQVGEVLTAGWIRLDCYSRYRVEAGFSGAAVWSPEYQGVVAVLCEAEGVHGHGRAITLRQADVWFPGERIRAGWGWSLAADPESRGHWLPRARGAMVGTQDGFRSAAGRWPSGPSGTGSTATRPSDSLS